jgi:hypothetical protein
MKKIVSFGDSFVFGNELQDNQDGNRAWPGLTANRLGCEYQTMAVSGCGNESIASQLYTYFSNNPTENTLAVINWTWCLRWDFFLPQGLWQGLPQANSWITLGSTCVPEKLKNLIGTEKAVELISFYQSNFESNQNWNIFRNLQTIYAAQCWLKKHHIQNVQTYMDVSMLKSVSHNRVEHYMAYKDPSWPVIGTEQELSDLPLHIFNEVTENFQTQTQSVTYIETLRNMVAPDLKTFEGQTFLDWSRDKEFPITELLHPLEQAHESAADLWQNCYQQILQI